MSKRVKVVLIVSIILIISGILFLFFRPKKPTGIPSKEGVEYNGLKPGISTRDDIINKLGSPLKEDRSEGQTTLEYASQSNPNFNNEFLLRSDTLVFAKQIVTLDDNIKISDIEQKYGSYENVLYGPSSVNGYNLYIYPTKGVAYLGHQQAGMVREIWYFQSTDLKTFQSSFAQDYSESPQAVQ